MVLPRTPEIPSILKASLFTGSTPSSGAKFIAATSGARRDARLGGFVCPFGTLSRESTVSIPRARNERSGPAESVVLFTCDRQVDRSIEDVRRSFLKFSGPPSFYPANRSNAIARHDGHSTRLFAPPSRARSSFSSRFSVTLPLVQRRDDT